MVLYGWGVLTPAREQMARPGRRGGVGEGYYMYILYTENCIPGLRKALPERFSVRIGRIAPSERIEEVWGIVKGGVARASDLHAPWLQKVTLFFNDFSWFFFTVFWMPFGVILASF